jgi:hypothetical protein
MDDQRVAVAVDAPVRALSPHEQLADPKDPLAEVGRIDALLAQALAQRLARPLVHGPHVVVARRDEQRALASAGRPGPTARAPRAPPRACVLANGALLTQHVECA